MTYKIKRWQLTLLLILMVCLGWIGGPLIAPAVADPRLESRLNRLESELGRLRSEVNRLESQLSIPRRPSPSPVLPPTSIARDPSMEDQFDNLATLAIETKLQVRDLDTRITRLEAALSDRS